jgi:hypothetical protein
MLKMLASLTPYPLRPPVTCSSIWCGWAGRGGRDVGGSGVGQGYRVGVEQKSAVLPLWCVLPMAGAKLFAEDHAIGPTHKYRSNCSQCYCLECAAML